MFSVRVHKKSKVEKERRKLEAEEKAKLVKKGFGKKGAKKGLTT